MAHSHPEVEAPARELVDQRGGGGVVGDVAGVDVGDRGAEGNPLGRERQRLAEPHAVAVARAVDAGEAAPLDLAGELEGRLAATGNRGQRHRRKGDARHDQLLARIGIGAGP
jgi:hypothetical protein